MYRTPGCRTCRHAKVFPRKKPFSVRIPVTTSALAAGGRAPFEIIKFQPTPHSRTCTTLCSDTIRSDTFQCLTETQWDIRSVVGYIPGEKLRFERSLSASERFSLARFSCSSGRGFAATQGIISRWWSRCHGSGDQSLPGNVRQTRMSDRERVPLDGVR